MKRLSHLVYECFNTFKNIKTQCNFITKYIPFESFPYINIINDFKYIVGDFRGSMVKHIKFTFDKTNIDVYILPKEGVPPQHNILYYIRLFIYILNRIETKHDENKRGANKQLKIVLTAIDKPKILPYQQSNNNNNNNLPTQPIPIGPIHVNGGVTYHGSACFVYRKEEFFKVLLHELMHVYKLDTVEYSIDNAFDLDFGTRYNVKSKRIGIHEAYNDMMTCLVYSQIYILLKHPDILKNNFHQEFSKMADDVSHFMMYNAAKIYNHYNVKPYESFTEETHVFSYYICKAALFHNWRVFLDTFTLEPLGNNNKRVNTKGIYTTNLDKFVNLLHDCLENKHFITALNDKMDNMLKTALNDKMGNMLKTRENSRSLRMLNVDIGRFSNAT